MSMLRRLGCCFLLLPVWLSVSVQAGSVLSVTHRGNSLFAPEHTLASFLAAQGKADLVETDGRLVIMHDATVDRPTDGSGTLAARPWRS